LLSAKRAFDLYKFDAEGLSKTLEKRLGQILRQSAREWLRTMIVYVPVETGMAKSALAPLGAFLRVAVPIEPIRKPYIKRKPPTYGGKPISMPQGRYRSKFTIIDDKTAPGTYQYVFEWSTTVLHYYLAHYYKGYGLPGEFAIHEANMAFWTHFETQIVRAMPDIQKFIRRYKPRGYAQNQQTIVDWKIEHMGDNSRGSGWDTPF
jgi:hypothetical protein